MFILSIVETNVVAETEMNSQLVNDVFTITYGILTVLCGNVSIW